MLSVRPKRVIFRGEAPRAPWIVAIALSVGLHVLLLAWPRWPVLREGGAAAPIGARLTVPMDGPARDAGGQAQSREAEGGAAPTATPVIAPPVVAPKPAPAQAAAVVTQAASAPDRPAPRPDSASKASTRAAPSPDGDPYAAAMPSDVVTVAQYRIVLMSAARRHARYPESAAAQGLEGRVDVRVAIGADGAFERVEIARSSGHPSLDDLALEIVRNATPDAPVPRALLARPFAVEVPVVFSRETR